MNEDADISLNIEWKQDKNGDKNTHTSRRIDEKKATMLGKKSPNSLDVGAQSLRKPIGVKKIRSKIKEVFDEDEDEEELEGRIFAFNNEMDNSDSSLLQGLKEEEKKKLIVEDTIKNQTMQQNAGKMTAILQANQLAKSSGLKKIENKIVNQNMLNVATDTNTFNNTVLEQIAKTEKIKSPKAATYKSTTDLVKGLGKVKQAEPLKAIDDKKAQKLEADELIEIGKEKSDEKVAKTILKKTGRKEEKKAKTQDKQEKIKTQKQVKEALKQKPISNNDMVRG